MKVMMLRYTYCCQKNQKTILVIFLAVFKRRRGEKKISHRGNVEGFFFFSSNIFLGEGRCCSLHAARCSFGADLGSLLLVSPGHRWQSENRNNRSLGRVTNSLQRRDVKSDGMYSAGQSRGRPQDLDIIESLQIEARGPSLLLSVEYDYQAVAAL